MIVRIAEAAVVCSIGAAYVALLAGMAGLLDARTVSLITLIGATCGSVLALVYLIAAFRDLRRRAP